MGKNWKQDTAMLPADTFEAITAHDSTNLNNVTRAVYVGGAGNVVAVDLNGNTVTFLSVPAGTVLPIVVKRINSTSTTASNMIGLS